MPTLQQPEAYLARSAQLFDEAGDLTDPGAADLLRDFGAALASWIDRLAGSN